MMAGLFWALAAEAAGCLLSLRWSGLDEMPGPRWASALAVLGSGTLAGIGLTSCLYWVCRAVVPSVRLLPMALEVALLGWLAWEIYRRKGKSAPAPPASGSPWTMALAAALVVAAGLGAAAMVGSVEANPHGNWDAWSIWNLRARFLASDGELSHRAWSDALAHANYPQLLPGFIARCWNYGGAMAPAIPAATAFLFWGALLALATGVVALLRGTALGLAFGLSLCGAPFFLREVASQYADLPLACYMCAAVLMLLMAKPAPAGLAAGLATWTKDEGLLFLVLFLAAAAAFRRGWMRAAAAALPAAAIALVFKLVVAPGDSSTLGRSMPLLAQTLTSPDRYATVLAAFFEQLAAMRAGWYHPLLPLVAIAALLRFDSRQRRDALLAAAAMGGMLAGYFGAYVISPYDLEWHLASSASRLAAQVWPLAALAVVTAVCAPESLAAVPEQKRPEEKRLSKKAKARR